MVMRLGLGMEGSRRGLNRVGLSPLPSAIGRHLNASLVAEVGKEVIC